MAGTRNPVGYYASSGKLSIDDAPGNMSDARKLVWLNAYESADRAYRDLPFYVDPAEVAGVIEHGWRRLPNPNRSIELPWQGATTYLGAITEIHYADRDGKILVQKFRSTALLWSSSMKEGQAGGAVFAYPGLNIPTPTVNAHEAPKAARIYSQWRDGNAQPRGASVVYFPVPNVSTAKPAVAIVYKSDKFSPGKKIDYMHHFEKGVRVRLGPGRVPNAIYVTGGRLKLISDGLVN